jgi:hypothetical protein
LQRKIADELDRTPGEILKKLEDIRNRIIWGNLPRSLQFDLHIKPWFQCLNCLVSVAWPWVV